MQYKTSKRKQGRTPKYVEAMEKRLYESLYGVRKPHKVG